MVAVLSMTRKAWFGLTGVLALLLLAACGPAGIADNTPSRSSAVVPVALLVPHGASDAQEQKLSRDLERAARLAVADLQGVEIDLRVYDTAGAPDRARNAALSAVSDGARIIVGPLRAESANAAALAVADRGINVLAFSNNPTIAGGNLFILGQTFETTARRLADYAARNDTHRILTLHSNNLAGQLGRTAIETVVADSGGVNVGSVGYDVSRNAVIDAVPRVQSAADSGNADAIFMTANAAGALPLFTQMLPEQGLGPDAMQYIGLARWDIPRQTLELPGLQGGWFALPDPGRSARFNQRFATANGENPHALASLAYDGIAAVGALASTDRRNALGRAALTQPAGFRGVNGVFRFRQDGTNERGLAIATIRDGSVVILENAPRAFTGSGS